MSTKLDVWDLVAVLIVVVGMLVTPGCQTTKKASDGLDRLDLSVADATPTPVPEVPAAAQPGHWVYVVVPGDSLWKISGKRLGDSFMWPELWRENRDQIIDPDLIESGMALRFKAAFTPLEVDGMMDMAKAWPAYQKHKLNLAR